MLAMRRFFTYLSDDVSAPKVGNKIKSSVSDTPKSKYVTAPVYLFPTKEKHAPSDR